MPFLPLLSAVAFFFCPACVELRLDEEVEGEGRDDVDEWCDEADDSTSEPSMDESDSLLLSLPLAATAAERRR